MVCESCRELIEQGEVIQAKGHTPAEDPAVEATCTEPGKTAGSHCSACGEVLVAQEVIPAGHIGGTATCLQRAICERCGQEYGELGEHQYEEVESAFEPTGEDHGRTALYRCKICDAEIPSELTGHQFSSEWSSDAENHWHACILGGCDAQQDFAPHTLENGVCTVCGYGEQAIIPGE